MSEKLPSTARLEAFSDGVIAVIITIMVLELKVPHLGGFAGLRAILPTLLVYLLSFTFTGIYWINHQHLVERIESADKLILYANLGFLFCLSLLPFFTAYVLEKKLDSFSVALYAVSMVVIGFSFFLLRLAIGRALRRSGGTRAEDAAAHRKHVGSLVLYLLAAPLARFHPGLALATVALVTLVWIIPISQHTGPISNKRRPLLRSAAAAVAIPEGIHDTYQKLRDPNRLRRVVDSTPLQG